MDFILLRYLGQRFIAARRCRCHFGLNSLVITPCSLCHAVAPLFGLAAKIVKQSTHLSNCPNFGASSGCAAPALWPLAGKSTLNRLEHAPDAAAAITRSRMYRVHLKRCSSIASSRGTSRRPPRLRDQRRSFLGEGGTITNVKATRSANST
jgi:hypothetical protein